MYVTLDDFYHTDDPYQRNLVPPDKLLTVQGLIYTRALGLYWGTAADVFIGGICLQMVRSVTKYC